MATPYLDFRCGLNPGRIFRPRLHLLLQVGLEISRGLPLLLRRATKLPNVTASFEPKLRQPKNQWIINSLNFLKQNRSNSTQILPWSHSEAFAAAEPRTQRSPDRIPLSFRWPSYRFDPHPSAPPLFITLLLQFYLSRTEIAAIDEKTKINLLYKII